MPLESEHYVQDFVVAAALDGRLRVKKDLDPLFLARREDPSGARALGDDGTLPRLSAGWPFLRVVLWAPCGGSSAKSHEG